MAFLARYIKKWLFSNEWCDFYILRPYGTSDFWSLPIPGTILVFNYHAACLIVWRIVGSSNINCSATSTTCNGFGSRRATCRSRRWKIPPNSWAVAFCSHRAALYFHYDVRLLKRDVVPSCAFTSTDFNELLSYIGPIGITVKIPDTTGPLD